MPTINNWGSQNPAQVSKGGTGNSSLTSHGILTGVGVAAVAVTAEPSDGQLCIGKTGFQPVLAGLTQGTGITITPAAGAITIAGSGVLGLPYEEVTAATKQMSIRYRYGANLAAGIVFTLPAISAVGDVIQIVGIDGIWSIQQNAGQTIYYGNTATTTGVTGSFDSTVIGDCITLRCITANTNWRAYKGWGNFNSSILPPSYFLLISSCGDSSGVTGTDGVAWSTGNNNYSQLGDGSITQRSSPVLVIGNHLFKTITIGAYNSAWLKVNGSCWCSGENGAGACGDYTTTSRSSPVAVVGNHSFISVKTIVYHTLALKANGEVWAWGKGQTGRLGDGASIDRSSPVLVIGNHSFIAIAAGQASSYALKANGEVWAWGYAGFGALGTGNLDYKESPVKVVGGHSFIKISSGYGFGAMALKADGSVYGWGKNDEGQLGDRTLNNKSFPVIMHSAEIFTDIGAGNIVRAALKADGAVWCTGTNSYGSLGNGTTTSTSSPVLVIGNHSFVQIACGDRTVLASKTDGNVWCWGHNSNGTFGNRTLTGKSSPVLMYKTWVS